MRQIHKEDKLYVAELTPKAREGYLMEMRRSGTFIQNTKSLAIAFAHQGKNRLQNTLGCMVGITESEGINQLPQDEGMQYDLVAIYNVAEHLDKDELPVFFQYVKKHLLPMGCVMIVIEKGEVVKHIDTMRWRQVLKKQGFCVERLVRWQRPPLNNWDNSRNAGKKLSPIISHIPLLRDFFAQSISILLSE